MAEEEGDAAEASATKATILHNKPDVCYICLHSISGNMPHANNVVAGVIIRIKLIKGYLNQWKDLYVDRHTNMHVQVHKSLLAPPQMFFLWHGIRIFCTSVQICTDYLGNFEYGIPKL